MPVVKGLPGSPEEGLAHASIARVLRHAKCVAWADRERVQVNDLVVVNNSFLHRGDVKTRKPDWVLGVRVRGVQPLTGDLVVVETTSKLINPFRLIRAQDPQAANAKTFAAALGQQAMGRLVFLLIGEIDDTIKHSAEVEGYPRLKLIELDPTAGAAATLVGTTLTVRDLVDERSICETVEAQLGAGQVSDEMRAKIIATLRAIDDVAFSRVKIPNPGQRPPGSVLDRLLTGLREQYQEYGRALARYQADLNDADAYTEILRVAYNFSSDAVKLIKLAVSVCDLKPLVGWCTVGEHYDLSQAFHEMPLIGATTKPGLPEYSQAIAAARNSRFHDLFPFKRAVHVDVPGAAIVNAQLRMFSKYKSKRSNRLEFEDQELVDLLTEFTRAGHRDVGLDFWKANDVVMERTIRMLMATRDALQTLNT